MRSRSLILALAAACIAVACTGAPAPDGSPAPKRVAKAPRNTITEDEFARAPSGSAYEVIQRLRPEFFSNRGETSIIGGSRPMPGVLINGVEHADFDSLRQIASRQIVLVRLYRASEVPAKHSSRFVSGLIEVTTR